MNELRRLKLALNKSHSAVYEFDTDRNVISWTGDVCDVLSLKDASSIRSISNYIALVHKFDKDKYQASMDMCLSQGGDYNRSYRLRLDNDTVISIRDVGSVVDTDHGKHLVGTITSDVHGCHSSAVQLSDNKNAVSSNGEYFNAEFVENLRDSFEESVDIGRDYALLKISIDNLPMMMTWYSLDFADRVMSALEVHLSGILRNDGIINRIAVDKFGIILKNHSESEMELVIDRIHKRIQLYNNPSFEEPVHLRTSIGSVRFPINAKTTEDALNKVYLALNSARSKSSEFHIDYQDTKKEHLDLKKQIAELHYMQNAFHEEKMHIAYQPIIRSKDGKVKGYECLLRIEDENGNLKSAGGLIPLAEKMGVVDSIDEYVTKKVVQELTENKDIVLSFNVSNLTTSNPKWLKICTRLLRDPDVASRIIVEITETAAERDMRQTAYFVAALQALGCKVALDDFGAGYTSFRQLKSLSVDIVKIDGAYVLGLEENTENLLFIETLLNFNHSYGVETVAECIENGEVAKILMDRGVDYFQGYYFGKPDIARPWAGERPSYDTQES